MSGLFGSPFQRSFEKERSKLTHEVFQWGERGLIPLVRRSDAIENTMVAILRRIRLHIEVAEAGWPEETKALMGPDS